jgi:hypothetical protein
VGKAEIIVVMVVLAGAVVVLLIIINQSFIYIQDDLNSNGPIIESAWSKMTSTITNTGKRTNKKVRKGLIN